MQAGGTKLWAWYQGGTRSLPAADGAPQPKNLQGMSDEQHLEIVVFATSLASSLRKCLGGLTGILVLYDSGVFLSPDTPYNPRMMGGKQMPRTPLIPLIIDDSDLLSRGINFNVLNIC